VRCNRIKRGGRWNLWQINKEKDKKTFIEGLTHLDYNKVQYALNKNPSYANLDIDIVELGTTKPLLYVCSQENSDTFRIIDILTEKGANIASENKNGEIPASLYIKSNDIMQNENYLAIDALLNAEIINNDKVWYAIFFPIFSKKLLDYLLDRFDKSFNYNLALQFILKQKPPNPATEAVTYFENHINSIATKLLERRPPEVDSQLKRRQGFADVNAATRQGLNTPLHFACWFYPEVHQKVIETILDWRFEANIDAQNKQGRTPLHLLLLNLSPYSEKQQQQQQLPEDVRNKIISIAKYLIDVVRANTDLTDINHVSVKSLAQEVDVYNELFRAQQPQVTRNYLTTPPLAPKQPKQVNPFSINEKIAIDVMGDKLTLFGECIRRQPNETCIKVENCYADEAKKNAQDYDSNKGDIRNKIKEHCYQKHLPQHITYGPPPPPTTTTTTPNAIGHPTQAST